MRALHEVARRTYDWIENTLGLRLLRAVARSLTEPGSLITERKMLRGIKARAGRVAAVSPGGTPS